LPDQVENLIVWQKSIELVKLVYRLTADFPKEELYGLTSQMRRAAVSIPANIAEGKGRSHKKEYVQFLYTARGSTYELSTLIVVAKEVGLLTAENAREGNEDIVEILAMLNGLISAIK
jgi:four helix bundle protein